MPASLRAGLRILALVLLASAASAEEFVVIVHPSNPARSLDKSALSQLMLKKRTAWENGTAAEPVERKADSALRGAFSKAVHGKSPSALKSYWQQQIFAGRSVPPPELATDQQVVDFVKAHPGAVGYVAPDAARAGVARLELR